jgi:hypothetical protein
VALNVALWEQFGGGTSFPRMNIVQDAGDGIRDRQNKLRRGEEQSGGYSIGWPSR